MSRLRSIWGCRPPLLKALAAQALAFALLALAAALLPKPASLWPWVLLQGALAVAGAAWAGLGRGWLAFQVLLPCALAWQLGHSIPGWVFPALLGLLLLIFGGGVLTRVPLYNSGAEAWEKLLELIPAEEPVAVADLGAGLGGPLAYLALRRPGARFLGVEASPLVWLAAWLRTLPRGNCRIRFGSLWHQPLGGFQLVFAFLSPAPMAALWDKARAEMAPGTLLVSHSFEIPGFLPERRVPLSGLPGACLLLYRIPPTESGP